MAKKNIPLTHGGQLQTLIDRFCIVREKWLDLSTGIAPWAYPIPVIPERYWRELPVVAETLLAIAKNNYQTDNLQVCAGSQAVIRVLPKIWRDSKNCQEKERQTCIWLPAVGYKEHEKSWRDNGFRVRHYEVLPTPSELTENNVVVVINPNNPTGELYPRQQLLELRDDLDIKNGWLIVDEAFMDSFPDSDAVPGRIAGNQSVAAQTGYDNLFVLRSFGKAFGLAGIRLGFVSAHPRWLARLADVTGPWSVNGPALFIAEQALGDSAWQAEQKKRLQSQSERLGLLLEETFCSSVSGTSLFQTVALADAQSRFENLCEQGVYVRLCDEKNALRFGIPDHQQYPRLEAVLSSLKHTRDR